ncbi:MAG: polysaccharide biosynthesis/export family protein [Bacteroidales bacterium]|nr:polysaccharide biosynthesis/export family protein [Bacteroidales bacterium]
MKSLYYFIAGLILLSSCVSQNQVKLIQDKAKEPVTQYNNARANTYRIQTGDHIYIRVHSVDPKTSKFFQSDFPYLMNSTYQYLNTYVVDEFGYINFSFIDKMFVKGMTVQEIKDALQTKLDEYFKDATAIVKLVNFQVAVLGEVNEPGNFTIEQDQINLFQAIGLAGGLTQYGNLKQVKLVRQNQEGVEVQILDLTNAELLTSEYFYLLPDDVIYIEPRSSKSFALSQFPYQTLVSFIAIASTAALFLLNE